MITHPRVKIHIAGRGFHLAPGKLWYLNTLHRHRLYNPTSLYRVQLVIDCLVNDWLRGLIRENSTRLGWLEERVAYRLRNRICRQDRRAQRIERGLQKRFGLYGVWPLRKRPAFDPAEEVLANER